MKLSIFISYFNGVIQRYRNKTSLLNFRGKNISKKSNNPSKQIILSFCKSKRFLHTVMLYSALSYCNDDEETFKLVAINWHIGLSLFDIG